MTISSRDAGYLWDLQRFCGEVRELLAGHTREEYLRSRMLQLVVERLFELIGEAARGVSDETRALAPDVPWARIVALRNVVAHQYRDVDHARLWQIATELVPALVVHVEALLPPDPPHLP